MSTSCIDPRGSTLSPENPRKWALTCSSFSLPMPILSKADAKMMLVELPLSTRPYVLFCWLRWPLLPVDRHEDAGSLPSRSMKRLWWYPAEGVWVLLVFLVSPLI